MSIEDEFPRRAGVSVAQGYVSTWASPPTAAASGRGRQDLGTFPTVPPSFGARNQMRCT